MWYNHQHVAQEAKKFPMISANGSRPHLIDPFFGPPSPSYCLGTARSGPAHRTYCNPFLFKLLRDACRTLAPLTPLFSSIYFTTPCTPPGVGPKSERKANTALPPQATLTHMYTVDLNDS
jgi:hypothetical protein